MHTPLIDSTKVIKGFENEFKVSSAILSNRERKRWCISVTTMICNYKACGHQQAQIVVLHFLKKASVKIMTCIIVSEKGG